MNIKKIFGQNIHENRKKKKLSQEELAEKLEISVKHLSNIETGKVFASAELIETIALVFKVSVASLFYSSEEKSFDDSDISKIENIIEEETQRSVLAIKERLHKKN